MCPLSQKGLRSRQLGAKTKERVTRGKKKTPWDQNRKNNRPDKKRDIYCAPLRGKGEAAKKEKKTCQRLRNGAEGGAMKSGQKRIWGFARNLSGQQKQH